MAYTLPLDAVPQENAISFLSFEPQTQRSRHDHRDTLYPDDFNRYEDNSAKLLECIPQV